MKQWDITALGEILMDCVSLPADLPGKMMLEANPGGAPANLLAQAALLGRTTAFIGKAGRDAFGELLADTLNRANIDSRGLVRGRQPTTLAMVTLDAHGDRSFAFYRNQTADVTLCKEEVDPLLLSGCRVFHFGSVSLSAEPARSTTLWAAQEAARQGAAVSYDPNYRPLLWQDEALAKEQMLRGLALAHLVKVSGEELALLSGTDDLRRGMEELCRRFGGIRLLVTTLGGDGCACLRPADGLYLRLPAFRVNCVDTTGAGDSCWGAFLTRLLEENAEQDPALVPADRLQQMLGFACAAGALTTTGHGAIPSLHGRQDITALCG